MGRNDRVFAVTATTKTTNITIITNCNFNTTLQRSPHHNTNKYHHQLISKSHLPPYPSPAFTFELVHWPLAIGQFALLHWPIATGQDRGIDRQGRSRYETVVVVVGGGGGWGREREWRELILVAVELAYMWTTGCLKNMCIWRCMRTNSLKVYEEKKNTTK